MPWFKKILFLSIWCCLSLGCTHDRPSSENPTPLLVISFDGFRYDYLSRTDTPNFDQFKAEGVSAKRLIPVFPTLTFPNHYTIATGLYPENSGIIGNTMYSSQWDEWYHINDREAVQEGKWYKGEPIWNTVEKQGRKAGIMYWVGSEADIQGRKPTHWKPYDGSVPFKARIDTVTKWLNEPSGKAVDFAMLYFEHLDQIGHQYGIQSDSLTKAIQRSDQLLGYLKSKLQEQQLWDEINIIILSDHGMVQLDADKIIELDDIINLNDIERVIWGPLTMLQPKKGKVASVYQALENKQNHYVIFKKKNLPGRYHLKKSRNVFDLLMIADLGYTILEEEYKSRFFQSLPRATHGYDSRLKKMQSIFLARGPAFKKGRHIDPFQNIHIYELMNDLMKTEPAANDGALDSVKVMLMD